MALSGYLTLEGESQGTIVGGVTQVGKEDTIEVNAFSNATAAPTDRQGSQTPFTISMAFDRATPHLHTALVNAERFTNWQLRLYRPAASGEEVHYFTIELIDARVSSIETEMLNNRYPENMAIRHREHVSFTYRQIERTFEELGITAASDARF